jgi:hypothetical protein
MTQEDKALLFKDLCARLPYGVMFPFHMDEDSNHKECDTAATIDTINEFGVEFSYDENGYEREWTCPLCDVKPYLRPMSSMTEEEWEDFYHNRIPFDGHGLESEATDIDWLNAHHFDYRGLIEKGLALEATEKIYN